MTGDPPALVPLDRIRDIADTLAKRIGLDRIAFGDEAPRVTIDDAYCFIICERGRERERRRTSDLDELLYWIFETVTGDLADGLARKTHRPGEDWRRRQFASQLDLLGRLSPDWRRRKAQDHEAILARYPFTDG